MSVESEILRIQHNIANSYAAVSSKGGEVPLNPTSANLAAAVSSIPQTLPPPDNNPIGTIISFMGTSAPAGYLVCDGSEYIISQYPALASFFEAQFGTKNHFGGNGTTTFAVPDMRNLFLRGYHGEAEEQLSGEVGERQEGTKFPDYGAANTMVPEGRIYVANPTPATGYHVKNTDSIYAPETRYISVAKELALSSPNEEEYAEWFTSRPVNMAVLYCIKAAESVPAENVYSTDETRIGTWIDGKPIYRRAIRFTTPATYEPMTEIVWHDVGVEMPNVDRLIYSAISIVSSDRHLASALSINDLSVHDGRLLCCIRGYNSTLAAQPAIAIVEYTKTTDESASNTDG